MSETATRMNRRPSLRNSVVIGFLLFQLVMIVHARFSPARYYCWAPHDAQNEYAIYVTLNDNELTTSEVTRRYRFRQEGVDPRAIEHVIRLIDHYERTLGKSDNAQVRLEYRTNGGPLTIERWPRP